MGLTIKEALALKKGTLLSFGNDHTYEVIDAKSTDKGRGIYIILEREDGLTTFAIESHLPKVTILSALQAIEKIVTPDITAQQLEQIGGESEIKDFYEVKNGVSDALPDEMLEAAKLFTEVADNQIKAFNNDNPSDDTAVSDKPTPRPQHKGKGKRK